MKNNNISILIKKSLPTTLTFLGSVGLIITVASSINATPKAIELIKSDSRTNHNGDPYASTNMEKIKSCWKCYIPTLILGVSTITCFWGANILNKKQSASIASAYALISKSYNEYKTKLKTLYGEEAHSKIMESIEIEKIKNNNFYDNATGIDLSLSSNEKSEEKHLFYDLFSHRYFESTLSKVIEAEYHLNRTFMFNGTISLNDFYNFLGLEGIPQGEFIGWSSCNGDIFWIDFCHRKIEIDKGLECYVIEMVFEPDSTFLKDL